MRTVRSPNWLRSTTARRLLMGGAAAVADLEHCWIPQSRNLRAIGERLRGFEKLERGELVIVSNTPLWMGTAPHFAFQGGFYSNPFAELATGVRPLETAREIVNEDGRLRVYHRNYMRDWNPQEAARTRVLVTEGVGRLGERRLLAHEVGPGSYRLYALKDYAGPPLSQQLYSREQLALSHASIYFARAFPAHGPLDW